MRQLVELRTERGLDFRIEIDGGIGPDTIGDAVRAGVELLVAGNAVFGQGNARDNTRQLLKLATEAALQNA